MGYDEVTSDELAGYRPVSPLAVAAVVCGLASVLVLVTPLAAMVPLLAVTLALAALADLRRSEGRRAGRPLALAGLALALGFAAQASAAAAIDEWIARRRASAAASAWLEAVAEGRFVDALAMCGPHAVPLPHEVTVGSEPPTPTVREAAFRATPAVQAVEACAAARPKLIGVRRIASSEAAWSVTVDLARCGTPDQRLRLELAPRSEASSRGMLERWLVVGLGVEH